MYIPELKIFHCLKLQTIIWAFRELPCFLVEGLKHWELPECDTEKPGEWMLLEKRHLSPCSTHGCHTPRFVNSMLSAKLNKTGQGRRAAKDELIREHDQSKNLNLSKLQETADFPGGASGKEYARQCRRHQSYRFDPWVGKIPWRRAWHPTPGFLPRQSHGQRSLAGYRPWGRRESTRLRWLPRHTGGRSRTGKPCHAAAHGVAKSLAQLSDRTATTHTDTTANSRSNSKMDH